MVNRNWVFRLLFSSLQSIPSLRVFLPSPESISFLKIVMPFQFRCEHSRCREKPFEVGPVVSFFVMLVSAQLIRRRSSPFNFLEKTRFTNCMARETRKFVFVLTSPTELSRTFYGSKDHKHKLLCIWVMVERSTMKYDVLGENSFNENSLGENPVMNPSIFEKRND